MPRGAMSGSLSQRQSWIDATRGGCVLAVVFFHVTIWHYLPLAGDSSLAGYWRVVNDQMAAARMPLLLLISGLLASRRVRLGWRDPGVAVRVASNYYLYLVWLAIYGVFFAVVGAVGELPHEIDGGADFLRQLVAPDTPLWYVMALAVYIAVLAAVRRAPAWLVLTVLTGLSLATKAIGTTEQWVKLPELFVYFAAGVYGAQLLSGFVRRVGPAWWVTLAALTGVLTVLAAQAGQPAVAGLYLLRTGSVALLGVATFVLAVRLRWVEAVTTWIGRRTLPIYVLHVPLVIGLTALLAGSWGDPLRRALAGHETLSAVYPLAGTALAVAACFAVRWLILAARLDRWLLELPVGLRERIDGTAQRERRRMAAQGV